MKERRTRRCNADAFFVSISRRARARHRCFSLSRCLLFRASLSRFLRTDPASLPPRRDLLGLGSLSDPFFDLAVDRVPSRSYRRSPFTTSLVLGSRRARSPPRVDVLPWGAQRVGLGLPGARGCGPAATPVLSTDVCCSRMLFSKTIAPRLGTRRIACSHAIRELAVSRRKAHFGEPSDRARVLSSPAADSDGVPLMPRRLRAPPAEHRPPASARDRSRDLRSLTRKPRPTPPSRVNGFLGLALARSTFSLCSLSARIGDPIRPLPRPRPFQDAISRESNESFCRVTDPRGTTRAPNPRRCRSALLSKRGIPSGVNGSVPGTAPRPVAPPRQGDRIVHAPSDPCGPALARPRGLPRRARYRHPSSSSDDLRGWVVPGISSADPGLATGCLPLSRPKEPEPLRLPVQTSRPGPDSAFSTPGSPRP